MSPVSLEMTVVLSFAHCCALLLLWIAYVMLSLYHDGSLVMLYGCFSVLLNLVCKCCVAKVCMHVSQGCYSIIFSFCPWRPEVPQLPAAGVTGKLYTTQCGCTHNCWATSSAPMGFFPHLTSVPGCRWLCGNASRRFSSSLK